LEFQSKQFKIQTDRSALYSQSWSLAAAQFPINEPASPNSQIQEFLNVNRGSGIQHIALQTRNIVQAIAQFHVVPFLPVPPATIPLQHQGLPLSADELEAILCSKFWLTGRDYSTLCYYKPSLSQFSNQPFFFEIIERRSQARGFGKAIFAPCLKRSKLNS